jgi:hypothetical protein
MERVIAKAFPHERSVQQTASTARLWNRIPKPKWNAHYRNTSEIKTTTESERDT